MATTYFSILMKEHVMYVKPESKRHVIGHVISDNCNNHFTCRPKISISLKEGVKKC